MNEIPLYVQIEGNKSLIRNTKSMGVINVDNAALQKYRMQRQRVLTDKARIQTLEEKIENLTNLVMKVLEINK